MKAREIRIEGDIAYIPLTHGYEAIIDVADILLVHGRNWHAVIEGKMLYACRNAPIINGKWGGRLRLHRVIMNAPNQFQVDHINCDGLDNRRSNLRIVTASQNQCNKRKPSMTTSMYKGVAWNKNAKKWQSAITINGNIKYLGIFADERSAHLAYCEASRELHGQYGRTSNERAYNIQPL